MKENSTGEREGKEGNWLNRTILGAGLTSAFGDCNYETCNVILPGFLAVLGIPAAALGAMEGVADGLSSVSKLAAGYMADKLGHRKMLVVLGYGLTALMPVLFALSGGLVTIVFARVIGWLGKGIRGPLRDAIVARSISPGSKGKAFGFHRAADSAGALIGPLLGVALLAWAQNLPLADSAASFRSVFWLALIPGLLSVASFALLVRDDGSVPEQSLRFIPTVQAMPSGFHRYLRAVAIFGMGDFAHTLLILAATQLLSDNMGVARAAMIAGLLYVWRNAVQTLVSFPVGALADRFGHRRLLVIGYGAGVMTSLLSVAAFLLHSERFVLALLCLTFTLAGLYVAIQEALEPSLTAEYVPEPVRGTGYGLLASVNGIGDLVSSTVVGLLWSTVSPVAGFAAAAAIMAAGTVSLALVKD